MRIELGRWASLMKFAADRNEGHDADFGPDGTPTPERGVAMLGGFS